MINQTRKLIALLRITSVRVIHDLASDMESLDGRSHYAEIAHVVFSDHNRKEIA